VPTPFPNASPGERSFLVDVIRNGLGNKVASTTDQRGLLSAGYNACQVFESSDGTPSAVVFERLVALVRVPSSATFIQGDEFVRSAVLNLCPSQTGNLPR